MKNKTFSLFALSVFALVLFAGAASATIDFSTTSTPLTIMQGQSGSFTFNIFNDGQASNFNQSVLNLSSALSALTGSSGTIPSSNLVLSALSSVIAPNTNGSGTLTINIPLNQTLGTYTGTISISGHNQDTNGLVTTSPILSYTVNVIATDLPPEVVTSNSTVTDGLQVNRITFTNNGLSSGLTFGTNGDWFPFENISAEVQIKNTNNSNNGRIDNIKVQWGLWDTINHRWVIALNDEKEFDLKTGATKTLEIPFSINNKMDVDLSDLVSLSSVNGNNLKFYVIATGEADTDSSPVSANGNKVATLTIQNDFVILNNFQIPNSAQCGKIVTITADAWNMDNDQNNVSVNIYNKDLGINQRVILGDINSFSRAPFSFDLKVPSSADEKSYPIQFVVYDDNNEVYQDTDNNEAAFTLPLVVQGSCVYASATTTYVNVELSSGGNAGQPLVLTATIKNLGDKTVDYTFNVNGYSSWAKLSDLSPSNLTLAPGESQEVAITLNVNANANGDKTFNFETYSNGQLITRQPLSATIASGFSLGSITGGAIGSSTPLIIGLVAVIFIVLILIIVVKASKK